MRLIYPHNKKEPISGFFKRTTSLIFSLNFQVKCNDDNEFLIVV
ncbi:hypothetical protein LCAA2362_2623 [Lacticaseibacillus casei A2-362]|nr:hypothetical protein LCAA2362_2623 [Lacticaseibacillus casei A2-362]